MATPETLDLFANLLRGISDREIAEPMYRELVQRGIIAALEDLAAQTAGAAGPDSDQAESASVISLLYQAAGSHSNAVIRQQAFHVLTRLAQEGHQAAVDSIYRLAVEADLLAARQVLLAQAWQPSRPSLGALFDWFTCLAAPAQYPQDQLEWITRAYLDESSPDLRRRLLVTAPQIGMGNWARIASALEKSENLPGLVEAYPSFTTEERQLTLACLEELAQTGSQPARETISRLFIFHDDPKARQAALANGYLPEEPEQRALFFFLAEDWKAYDTLDFNQSLLVNAYESANRPLRRRLLEHSRYTGRMDWLRKRSPSGEIRWISDLTDADWDLSIRRLNQDQNFTDLWRLSQVAPPVWSAAMLDALQQQNWIPETEADQSEFQNLVLLARESLSHPLLAQPKKALHAPAGNLTCLAIHPTGQVLAAGSGDQRIFLWDLPQGDLRVPPLAGPTPAVRALAFDSTGDLLACASSDQRIRIFRLKGGQIIKTLEGHRAMIRSLALNPNGRVLYSASFDGSIRFWRFPYGPELKTLNPGPAEIFSLALSADGNHLLSSGTDGLVRVWALPEGAAVRELTGHPDTITHLAPGSTGDLVASAGRDGTIRLWNFTSGNLLRAIENPYGALSALTLHPNDQVLIGGHSDGAITLWSLSTGKMIDRLAGHRRQISGLVLSPGGDALYSCDAGGELLAWDLRTFLAVRLPTGTARPGAVAEIQNRLKQPGLPSAERAWLVFTAALARFRQRYDIELSEAGAIPVGEFDIEIT